MYPDESVNPASWVLLEFDIVVAPVTKMFATFWPLALTATSAARPTGTQGTLTLVPPGCVPAPVVGSQIEPVSVQTLDSNEYFSNNSGSAAVAPSEPSAT